MERLHIKETHPAAGMRIMCESHCDINTGLVAACLPRKVTTIAITESLQSHFKWPIGLLDWAAGGSVDALPFPHNISIASG